MDRGFGVASSSLVVNFHGLEHRPLSLSSPETQNGVEEEDGSPFEEIGGRERVPCGLRGWTGEESSFTGGDSSERGDACLWGVLRASAGREGSIADIDTSKGGDACLWGILQASPGREGSVADIGVSKRGYAFIWGCSAKVRAGAGASLIRLDEHLGLPRPNSFKWTGSGGLGGDPIEAETWSFPSPGHKPGPNGPGRPYLGPSPNHGQGTGDAGPSQLRGRGKR